MSEMLELYKAHTEGLKRIREEHGGVDSAEEDAHLDAMDYLWKLLTEEERVEATRTCCCTDEKVPHCQFHLMFSPKHCPECGSRMVVWALDRDGKRFIAPGIERCFNVGGNAKDAKVPGPCRKAGEPHVRPGLEKYTEELAEQGK